MPEWLKRLTKSDIRNSLAIIIVFGCFILLYLLQSKAIPEQNHDLVLTIGGFVFGGALAGVIGFYFGSTKIDKKNEDREG
jgi:dolichol kinase